MVELVQQIFFWAFPFLLVLAPLVFFHELGHFSVARFFGVGVEVFSIGFGPEIWGWNDRRGTRWKISAIPLGGYVQLKGEGENKEVEKPVADGGAKEPAAAGVNGFGLCTRHPVAKMAISLAGPLANFLLAVVLLFAVFRTQGMPTPSSRIAKVIEGGQAERAGFQEGDTIKRVGQQSVESLRDVLRVISLSTDETFAFEIERMGQLHLLLVGRDQLKIAKGLGLEVEPPSLRSVNLWESVAYAVQYVRRWCHDILVTLTQLATLKQAGGILMIAKESKKVVERGWHQLFAFAALLSVNLGLVNLLPIPALDGGQVVLYGLEWVWGRALSKRILEWFARIGLVCIVTLLLLTTWNDVNRLGLIAWVTSFCKGLFA
jgi:regulator of sigma E protease